MLQRAASNAYSWWWASHIRTKQSKWLDTDLEEMGERMQTMIKIIDEDGDSFARKAEMYFKKRPELLESVEQTYKAYRALAEKYDHISSELHKANHTIATAFPDQIEFDMQDEECASLNLGKAISSGKLGKPSAGVPRIGIPNKNKKKETERSALKKSRLARVASQRSKAKAQDEIDKLQKGILVLQTEKEYIRTSYESGVAKYSDIERQITEMQEDVFSLQDAYGANAVIEDDAARTLMTATALRSCESSLAKLQEQQKRVMEETKIEMEKVKKINAKEKIHQSSEEVTNEEEESIIEPASLCEHIEISSDVSVEELAEKINELVSKVISYEMSASSQTAQMKRMSAEIDVLHRHLLNSDEDKRALTNDVNSLCERLLEAQEELKRMQHVEEKLKRKLKRMQQAEEERKRTQEVKESVLIASEEAISIQNEKAVPSVSVTTVEEAINSVQNETAGPSTTTSVTNEEAISAQNEIMAAPSISMTDKEAISISVQNEEAAGSSASVTEKEEAISIQNEKPIEHSEADDGSKQAQVTPQVVKQAGVVEISSSQSVDHVELSNASKLQLETNHSENSSGFEERDEEVKITSQDSIHQSKKFSPKLKKSVVGHSEVKNNPSNEENVKAESIKSQVAEQEDRIHGNATESKLQFEQDPDASLNSLQSLVNKLQGKEKKIILTQLESTFRNYRDTKKKLSEIEKQNQEHNIEISKQIRELKSSNAMKDAEIHALRKNLRSLQLKSTGTARISDPLVFESEPRQATSLEDNNFEPHTISVIEEKFRQDVDTVLEENLEFWLRFNSSSQNRQLFQTTFEDIQAEIDSLKLKKSGGEGSNHKKSGGEGSNHKKSGGEGSNHKKSGGEGSNHSNAAGKQANLESLLIEKKLKELKTEIHVWLEQNALLQGELESKYSSLSNIQEEISATLEASLEGNIEEEGLVFAPYQAAKFQGELLNIQLENNKVSEELMAGMEDARELQGEIENTLARLHGKKLPKALESAGDGSNKDPLRHSSTKNQVPLRSFLFSQKPKRKSMFSKVNPALQIRMAGRGRGRGGGGGRGRGRSSS